ncbi:hypothetical protein FB451DRAFT_449225 [Mycena latifolia]|nr:hypothetical protein FB451DRAFT_449225 [Mycena latifolia]
MFAGIQMVFHIQELCDHIARHIALHKSSHDDLKSTALVCQTLCSSAQSQIFRQVSLDPWEVPGGDTGTIYSTSDAVVAGISAARRLSAVLTASPHLLRHIRCLSVLGRLEILELVSNMRIPFLQKIRINFDDTPWSDDTRWSEDTRWDDEVLRVSRDLIGSPSIREVEIHNVFSSASQGLSLDLFTSLFETRPRDIYSLGFFLVKPTSPLPPRLYLIPREGVHRSKDCSYVSRIIWGPG